MPVWKSEDSQQCFNEARPIGPGNRLDFSEVLAWEGLLQ